LNRGDAGTFLELIWLVGRKMFFVKCKISQILNYSIPMICLENFDIPSVCAVYERVNGNGVKLDNLDILIARSFKNDPAIIDEDFPVPQ
jgi:hypothetical protein